MALIYTMEAVRNFQAMDSDCHVRKGETLTLILDNKKLCLVHRKDDLPFVVPTAYICLQTPLDVKRTGSFSKFLRDRKTIRNRQKYPLSTFNLESVSPQFGIVTDPFSATSFNEVDLPKDTAVLILNADPQSLYWFGITQCGAYGFLPRNNVSFITLKGTPSLQQGCRLTAYTRKAFKSEEHDELTVRKGWSMEIIGMPEMWRWQVRLSRGERKVGLLPIHVISEVSVITSPEDGDFAEIMHPPSDNLWKPTSVRPPSILDPTGVDPTNLTLMVRTSQESVKRRNSRPLPSPPGVTSQSLNDLNRNTQELEEPNYINSPPNHFSLISQDSGHPHELVSDESGVPVKLRGIFCQVDRVEDGRNDPLDGLERMIRVLRRDREALERSRQENRMEAHYWRQTADNICRIVNEAQATTQAFLSRSQTELRSHDYYAYPEDISYIRQQAGIGNRFIQDTNNDGARCDRTEDIYAYDSLSDVGRRDDQAEERFNTVPRKKSPTTLRQASLDSSCPGTDTSNAVSWLLDRITEEAETTAHLPRSSSQPLLYQNPEETSLPLKGELVIMPTRLNDQLIDAVVSQICPLDARRPQLHWKQVLVELGLHEDTARKIANSELDCTEQWREALLAWKDERNDDATTNVFLEKIEASGHQDLYRNIVTKCTLIVKPTQQRTVEDAETFV